LPAACISSKGEFMASWGSLVRRRAARRSE